MRTMNLATDCVALSKITKYILDIKNIYETLDINSSNDLRNNRIAQLAVTQSITNIYETKKHIQNSTIETLVYFNGIILKTARHISSHDYEQVDFEIIFKLVKRLLNPNCKNEIQSFIENNKYKK